jgi:hypothetical protein
MNDTSLTDTLSRMPSMAILFQMFLSGKHLNRTAEPALWAELERNESGYVILFGALGYRLILDARGFAWFDSGDQKSGINKTSRRLSMLFMLIFDAQANAGKPLDRFTDWLIDDKWLTDEVYKQHQDLMDAMGIDQDALIEMMNIASKYGFALTEKAGWRLLPAVYRYLEYFERLASVARAEGEENLDEESETASDAEDWNDDELDEEENEI